MPIPDVRVAMRERADRRVPPTDSQDRPAHIDGTDLAAIQRSPEFIQLRRRLRLFVFPVSAAFFCWYMVFAVLSAYDHEFMKRKVDGEVNMGTVLGLLQFATTIVIVLMYRRFARKKLDPQVDMIHELAGAGKE
ncbi:DUF485 domain-containing protein [Streptomyces silvisoli]|uniref:DUF485 domain-containing protein n=1 Tax=Streptomyces silvisoli TaxID=3034235 RepID=A0ABT5ZUE3_9ACTN|nr:DUF485 domain-containing protein [Streptomyces silvisoli]MDF3293271.1 DUF485 domain-containing protein [Streptomyces silvisoli]